MGLISSIYLQNAVVRKKRRPIKKVLARPKPKKLSAKKEKLEFRNKLVLRAPLAEKVLKKLLLHLGIRYKFQKIKGNRFVDFYFPQLKWIMEIDGEYHNTIEQMKKDKERSEEILRQSPDFTIVRYTNEQVLNDPGVIINAIIGRMLERYALCWPKMQRMLLKKVV